MVGATPVAELVAATVYWVDPAWFVPALGLASATWPPCRLAGTAST